MEKLIKLIAIKNIYENDKTIIIKKKEYLIYSIFESDKFKFGKGCVVLCEDNSFHGLDHESFKTEQQIKANDFNL